VGGGILGPACFRLVSLNLNGILSAAAKGFEVWAEGVGADCMGVQEIKAQADVVAGRFDRVSGLEHRFGGHAPLDIDYDSRL
jgi:exodeoxyribonuclease-3